MKTPVINKNLLIFRFVVVFLICASACSKNNELEDGLKCQVEAKNGQDDDIIGEWKLVKGQTVFHDPRTIDFSCDNVTYTFQEDGTLEVSGSAETVIGLGAGKYSFQLHREPLESSDEEFTLQIDELVMGSEISADAMIINHSYLDGPILYFVRIR